MALTSTHKVQKATSKSRDGNQNQPALMNLKGTKPTSKKMTMKDMQAAMEWLKEERDYYKKKAKRAEKEKQKAELQAVDELIPKPKGKMSIVKKMQMDDDRQKYKSIQHQLRELSIRAGFDFNKTFTEQGHDKRNKLYKAAQEQIPELKRYVNDWATIEIVKQFVNNQRKWDSKKGHGHSASASRCREGELRTIDEIEDDEEQEEAEDVAVSQKLAEGSADEVQDEASGGAASLSEDEDNGDGDD
ncbi:hypothetical protein EW146_g6255 [Bondarzewia mesenterica]|uniref:Uncharacterized protein n=1 Tax=Bondarzewia mesenterica TaxID=1095465 RepID=A0A4S4LP61_9AGAM|nr:hypothetical protein EW146_g6255 [Bondarzewia mesenterica]